MMDAFKGVNQAPKMIKENQGPAMEDGNHSKAWKSLHFDETVNAVMLQEAHKDHKGSIGMEDQHSLEENLLGGEEAMKNDIDHMEQDQQSAFDDANLMVEGVLLSDSELLDEEWEEGEVPEFMEKVEDMLPDAGLSEWNEIEIIYEDRSVREDNGAKASKKKGLKRSSFGGATKKCFVQNLPSPGRIRSQKNQ